MGAERTDKPFGLRIITCEGIPDNTAFILSESAWARILACTDAEQVRLLVKSGNASVVKLSLEPTNA